MRWYAISKYRGGVEVLKFWIVCPLKILIFGRSKHLKNSSQILANTFYNSLATPNFFSWRHMKIPGSLPVPVTLSELWEWLFPVPFQNSWRERTPLQVCTTNPEVPPRKAEFPISAKLRIGGWGGPWVANIDYQHCMKILYLTCFFICRWYVILIQTHESKAQHAPNLETNVSLQKLLRDLKGLARGIPVYVSSSKKRPIILSL